MRVEFKNKVLNYIVNNTVAIMELLVHLVEEDFFKMNQRELHVKKK